MKYELRTIYDGRKSFYKKAFVYEEGKRVTLRSYTTDVAFIQDGKAFVNGMYSNTTARHIKEFLKQNGFVAESSKQILKDYDADREGKPEDKEPDNAFKCVNMVMAMGRVFSQTQAERNAWDKRMLSTQQGIVFPDDWDALPEEEQTKRLEEAKKQIA